MPERIQLKRTKGWRMQEHSRALNGLECVKVTRPGKWGNPFKIGDFGIPDAAMAVRTFRMWIVDKMIVGPPGPGAADLEELRGKNLACFCSLDEPCHADVLLELANGRTHNDA